VLGDSVPAAAIMPAALVMTQPQFSDNSRARVRINRHPATACKASAHTRPAQVRSLSRHAHTCHCCACIAGPGIDGAGEEVEDAEGLSSTIGCMTRGTSLALDPLMRAAKCKACSNVSSDVSKQQRRVHSAAVGGNTPGSKGVEHVLARDLFTEHVNHLVLTPSLNIHERRRAEMYTDPCQLCITHASMEL